MMRLPFLRMVRHKRLFREQTQHHKLNRQTGASGPLVDQ
jgi:hypothetical protein